MIAYIICEANFDTQLLKAVLPKELLNNVEVVNADTISNIKSLARSLIVRRQVPVVIVVDADSVDPDLIQERCNNIQKIVESVSINTPVKVILAIPEMETIFFQDTILLSRLLGLELAQEIIILAKFQPRQALKELLSQSKNYHDQSQLMNQLANEDLKIIRKAPVIQELIQFLQSVREPAKV